MADFSSLICLGYLFILLISAAIAVYLWLSRMKGEEKLEKRMGRSKNNL